MQKKHHKKKTPEHRAELKAHFETNMLPVLTEKQNAFDAQLSSSDLQFLNGKRAEAAQIRAQKKEICEERKALKEADMSKEEIRAAIQPKRENIRQQNEALAASMQSFIDSNQELIQSTMEELKPYRKQWKEERRAIHEKYVSVDDQRPEGDKKECNKGEGKGKNEGDRAKRKERKVVKFLLWNGESPEDEEAMQMDDNGFGFFDSSMDVEVYPNPATDNTTVKFELANTAKQVNISISDVNGRVVRQVSLGTLNAGSHSTQIPVNDLAAGRYLYTLDIDGNQQTKSIIVQR